MMPRELRSRSNWNAKAAGDLRVIRCEQGEGYIVGRNQIVREAGTPYVLLLDDDASLLDAASVIRAIGMLDSQPRAGAIAFAQTTRSGQPWGERRVSAAQTEPCFVAAYYGFAHLVRRDVFLALGGYRDRFEFYGEEKEFCLRLIEAGYRTVYLPGSPIAHEPDPVGPRSTTLSQVRHSERRAACPLQRAGSPSRLAPACKTAAVLQMRRAWRIDDPFGWAWVLSELGSNFRPVLRDRRPVSATTRRVWRELGRAPVPVWAAGEQPMES